MQRVQRHRTLWARLPSGSVRNSKDKGEACKLVVALAITRRMGRNCFRKDLWTATISVENVRAEKE